MTLFPVRSRGGLKVEVRGGGDETRSESKRVELS
jgi:hypothetical protein